MTVEVGKERREGRKGSGALTLAMVARRTGRKEGRRCGSGREGSCLGSQPWDALGHIVVEEQAELSYSLNKHKVQLKGGPQVSRTLFLLLLRTSALSCLQHSRNHGPTFQPSPVNELTRI